MPTRRKVWLERQCRNFIVASILPAKPQRLVKEQAIQAIGKRRVVLSVPNFNSLLSALAHSDLVAVVPERLVRDEPALLVQEPPLSIPGFEMLMLWPERLHRDPAHMWLRELIASNVPGTPNSKV